MGAVVGAAAVAGVGVALYRRSRLRPIPDIDVDQMEQDSDEEDDYFGQMHQPRDEEDDDFDQDMANLQNDNRRIDVDNAFIEDEIHRIRVKSKEELERVLQDNVDKYVARLSQHPILSYRGRSPDQKFWKRYVEGRPVGAMHLLKLDGVTLQGVSRADVAVVYQNRIVLPFLALRMQGKLPGILTPGEARSIYRRLIAIHRERL
jgi:hypothetical protein